MLFERLLDVVAPQRCACCARFGASLCPVCTDEIASARPSISRVHGMRVHALGPHSGALRRAVLAAKFARRERAARALGALAWRRLRVVADALVPVPMHPLRERQRGYNQALAIAEGYARAAGVPVLGGAVERRVDTAPQTGLPRALRARNLDDALVAGPNADRVSGMRLAIVDDVVTTGATVLACGRALRAFNPASIVVVALSVRL